MTLDVSAATSAADLDRQIFDRARRDRSHLIDRARLSAEIEAAGFDALIACSHINVIYTTGVYLPVEMTLPEFALTTAGGQYAAISNDPDANHLAQSVPDVRSYQIAGGEEAAAVALLQGLLSDFGLLESVVGIEFSALSSALFEKIAEACPQVVFKDAEALLQRARVIKTPGEIELLAAAGRAVDRSIAAAFDAAYNGITEKTLAATIQSNTLLAGADGFSHTNVNSGVHSTLGHVTSLEDPILDGEIVYVDFGGSFAGYCTDLARNAVMGTPSPTQLDFYQRMFDIHLAFAEWLKPGVTGGEAYEWGQEQYKRAGLVYPWGTFGHSIGLDMHEGFEFSVGSESVLEPGMVVCIELTHTEPDGRYHVEDMVAVTETGVEHISNGDKALIRGIGTPSA